MSPNSASIRFAVVTVSLLVLSGLFFIGIKAYNKKQAEKAARIQQIRDARALCRVWADRLDGQTDEAGVYQKYNEESEAQLPEKDPWGHDLKVYYSRGGMAEILKVSSLGPDGKEGSDDDVVETRQSTNLVGIRKGVTETKKEITENTVETLKDKLIPSWFKKKEQKNEEGR
jgi:hypothetical protein